MNPFAGTASHVAACAFLRSCFVMRVKARHTPKFRPLSETAPDASASNSGRTGTARLDEGWVSKETPDSNGRANTLIPRRHLKKLTQKPPPLQASKSNSDAQVQFQ
jgi:hypothetical protein